MPSSRLTILLRSEHTDAQGSRSTLRSITLRQASLGEEDEMSMTF
jgi:hypothetical protein